MSVVRPLVAAGLCLLGLHTAQAEDGQAMGAALYATHCQACHQADGQGTPSIAPPLAGRFGRHVATPDGRRYLARVPLTGMFGAITVDGQRYLGAMPSFATLADAEVAAVLAYVLRTFNGVADLGWLDPAFVADVRRGGGTPTETHALRGRLPAAGG